jgi:hypothetical protein
MPIPIIVSPAVTGTGPTLLRLRQRLADELGTYLATTVSAAAASGEASRVVIADEVRDDEAGYPFLGQWLYVRNGEQAGEQRRIISQPEVGYQGARSALLLSRPFDAPLAEGTVVEITGPLPVVRHLGVKGLHESINEALGYIRVPARLALTGAGTRSISLASHPWLTSVDQTMGVWDAYGLTALDPLELASLDYRFVSNGVDRTLVTARSYASSETVHLGVIVPADRLVYDGAAWMYASESALGLSADTHQTAAPEPWVLAFGMYTALKYLRRYVLLRRDLGDEIRAAMLADIDAVYPKWVKAAARIKRDAFPQPAQGYSDPLFWQPSPPEWL